MIKLRLLFVILTMIRRSLLVLFAVFSLQSVFAQDLPKLMPEERRMLYTREWSFMPSISSRGWGLGLRHSRVSSNFRKLSFETELAKVKHPKEIKVVNPYFDNAKSYVYGKKNAFYTLRAGMGTQFLLFDKAPQDGVEISFTIMGGLSQGLLKPIYLEIIKETNINYQYEIVTERYNEYEHFAGNIYGYSGFLKGLNELNLVTGGYVRSGLSFDWSSKDNKILSLETGTIIDLYPKRVPIMADFGELKNKQVFISFYANLLLGKKY